MRNVFLISLLTIVPMILSAQTTIEKFYNKYMNHPKATDIELSGWLLKMAVEGEVNGAILDKITRLRIMVMEEANIVTPSEYRSFKKSLQRDDFTELMQIRDDGADIRIMMREKGDQVTNLLVLVHETDNFVLLSLEGLMSFDDIRSLNFDVEGGQYLKKVSKKLPRT